MLNDFKAFVIRGNVLGLPVAVIIGAAFGAIVKSVVNDVVMRHAATTKDCTYCTTAIPIAAKRCPHCTSQLTA